MAVICNAMFHIGISMLDMCIVTDATNTLCPLYSLKSYQFDISPFYLTCCSWRRRENGIPAWQPYFLAVMVFVAASFTA